MRKLAECRPITTNIHVDRVFEPAKERISSACSSSTPNPAVRPLTSRVVGLTGGEGPSSFGRALGAPRRKLLHGEIATIVEIDEQELEARVPTMSYPARALNHSVDE